MLNCDCLLFFFYKQKTAYEVRISDWSSDVCSSDLLVAPPRGDDDIAQTIRGIGLFGRLRRTSGWAGSGSSPSPRRAEAGILRLRGRASYPGHAQSSQRP